MRSRPTVILVTVFLCLFFSLCWPALAQEAPDQEGGSIFVGQLINFVVLFGTLAYFLWKPLNNYLKGKSEEIAELLKQSEDLKADSLSKLEQTRIRLGQLEEEIKSMKLVAEKEALSERERIKEEARRESEKLKKMAREEIDMLAKISLSDLKAYAINLGVALAEKRMREKLTPELHRKLIHKSMDNLRTADEQSVNS
ncbi:MAG: ATP synthase F0 subunit B [Acidobacteriota bacterium]|nr:ATP synthase F0 subunit B [Acidobacteriota bacterium]MDW3229455.1 ATP synthase F0 subunit B [Acidobacteriota bacterium]MDY0231579.1 ATP synthase F0 subunit B [Candidatus Saccharicenans sp.]